MNEKASISPHTNDGVAMVVGGGRLTLHGCALVGMDGVTPAATAGGVTESLHAIAP